MQCVIQPSAELLLRSVECDRAGGVGAWPPQAGLRGPLAGVRVLDLSRVLAGPYATMLLGDMGADVIKVESPAGDATRGWGPPFLGETAVYYLSANRNKRSVVLDLVDEYEAKVAHALAADADVVVSNFKTGRAERFGLAYEDLRELNPRCVYCTITGFGSGTTREHQPAYDLVVQALGGMMAITGVEGEAPVKVGVATADLLAGLQASSAILAALFERERAGRGRHIEVALLDTQIAGLANQALNWLAAGYNPPRLGSDHPNVAPYGAFATATTYVVIAIGNDRQFAELAAAVGHEEWADDPRFASNPERVAHREALRKELEALLRGRPADEWLAVIGARGVPCAPVLDVAEVFGDPEVSRRTVVTIKETALGDIPQVRTPVRLDGQPLPNMHPPPALGEHSRDVLNHVRRHLDASERARRGEPNERR